MAADVPIEARGPSVSGERFHLVYRLADWKQVYNSESAEQKQEEEDGVEFGAPGSPSEADSGTYSVIDKVSGQGRCYLKLESNAIFSRSAPQISPGTLSGPGTHLLKLSRRELKFTTSGSNGAVRWYLGSLHGTHVIGLSIQPAPPSQARSGLRYLVAEVGLERTPYRVPRDFYLSPPPTKGERAACLKLQQHTIYAALLPILQEGHSAPGPYRPGRKVPGHELPRCVAERCPGLLETPTVQIYQTIPLWDTGGPSAHHTFVRWRQTGRITSVGSQTPPHPLIKATGRYVAYSQSSYSKYNEPDTAWSIFRVDAATGRRFDVPAGLDHQGDAYIPTTDPGVTDLALAPDGALAWIIAGTFTSPRVSDVYRLQAGSRTPEWLAGGEAVEPGTLTVGSGIMRWREGQGLREAPFG